MESIRNLTPKEECLLGLLVKKSSMSFPNNWKENLLVQTMKDAGMVSLVLFPESIVEEKRRFGKCISEFQFIDQDGVVVIASLNIDDKGKLFELDMWKTDYSPLINIPDNICEIE